jgi:hypothetical protein
MGLLTMAVVAGAMMSIVVVREGAMAVVAGAMIVVMGWRGE